MQTKIITGNFSVVIDGEIGSGQVGEGDKAQSAADAINEAGITYIVQRDGLSGVYKTLLEKGAKRDSLEFSDETAQQFAREVEKQLAPYGAFSAEVSEHVPSEGGASPKVMATAMWEQVKGTPMAASLPNLPADATDEQGIAACHAFLGQFRKTPVRKAKAE